MSHSRAFLGKIGLFLGMLACAAGVVFLMDFLYNSPEAGPAAKSKDVADDLLPEEVRGPGAVLREDREVVVAVEPGQRRMIPAEGGRDRIAMFDVGPKEGPLRAAAIPVKNVLAPSADEEDALTRSYCEIRAGVTIPVRCDAKADEVGTCFLKNAGDTPVTARVRVRSWTVAEAPPGLGGDFTRVETLEPGRTLEFFIVATKPTRWSVVVAPKGGEVFAGLASAGSSRGLTSVEKGRLLDVVRRVSAGSTESLGRFMKIGEVGCCGLVNRGDRAVTVEIRSHLTK